MRMMLTVAMAAILPLNAPAIAQGPAPIAKTDRGAVRGLSLIHI